MPTFQKMPIVFFYMSLNRFIYITRCRLNKLRKTTLPTYPYRKTYRLIQFLTPVYSGETLPLKPVETEHDKTSGFLENWRNPVTGKFFHEVVM
jgi:hypothetical protein